MGFNIRGLRLQTPGGVVTVSGRQHQQTFATYIIDDSPETVEAPHYFDAAYESLRVGTVIRATLSCAVTPVYKDYIVRASDATGVTIAACWEVDGPGGPDLSDATSGEFSVDLHAIADTAVTLPPSGTLATTAQLPSESSPLAIANGGTGQTTAAAAFNALSPMTTAGDMIYGGTSGAGTRLPAGTSSQVLVGGATPSWETLSLNNLSNYIADNRTIIVAPSGGDYATVADAIAYLNTCIIAAGVDVTLQVNDGVYTSSVPVLITTPFGRNIMLKGQHARTTTVTAVQSSSGSAGAWSIVLDVASVDNITAGNYVALTGLSGGSNPEYLAGVWPVTDVDAVNARITISTTHRGSTAPSGAVSGAVKIYTSILSFTNCDGIRIWNGGVGINAEDILLAGNGGTRYGWSIQDGCRLNVNAIAVYGFGTGVYSLYSSELNGDSIVVSGCQYDGLLANNNGVINLHNSVVSGNGANGAHAMLGGTIDIPGVVATGNGANGTLSERGGHINADGGKAIANAVYGFNTIGPAYTSMQGVTASGNTVGSTSNTLSVASLQATSSLKAPKWYPQTDGTTALQITKANGSTVLISFDTTNNRVSMGCDFIQHPSSSIAPANNGDLVVEATSDTAVTFKLKGSDGTVRSVTLTLS